MTNSTRTKGTNSRIEIRITEEEKAILREQKAAGELARLGGLQKHLLTQIKGLPDEEGLRKGLNSTLLAVQNAMRALKTDTVK